MPPTFDHHAAVPTVKVRGVPLLPPIGDQIASVVVEAQRNLPATCTVEFWEGSGSAVDHPLLVPGNELEVTSAAASEDPTQRALGPLFKGEIVAIEAAFTPAGSRALVRAYDKAHRLHRQRRSRTFLRQTDSGIVQKIAGDNGVAARIEPTTTLHEYLCQRSQTDWEFLNERARENGYEVAMVNGVLVFRRAGADPVAGIPQQLELGATLLSFRARVSSADQPTKVRVNGWDASRKVQVRGLARPPSPENTPGDPALLATTVGRTFSGEDAVSDPPLADQGAAMALASAHRDQAAGSAFEADGTCFGNPALVAGGKVAVRNAGVRYSGTYTLSSVRHVFDDEGYLTHFTISGRQDRSLLGLTRPGAAAHVDDRRGRGLLDTSVLATVSNTNDPEQLGRVKVQFAWLDDQLESTWAPVLAPGGGKARGWHLLPEVNDQVLVVFEQGDPRRPYVLGGIYNSTDKPPQPTSQAVVGGSTDVRTFRTRVGHELSFVDTGGKEQVLLKTGKGSQILITEGPKKSIKIVDASGSNQITIDGDTNQVTVKSSGKLVLDAVQDLELTSKAKVKITGTAGVDIQGQGPVNVKSSATLGLEGQATTSVKASGPLTVQGTPIKLN